MSPNLLSALRDILVLGPWATTHYLPSCALHLWVSYTKFIFLGILYQISFFHIVFIIKLGNLIIFLPLPTSVSNMSLTIFNSAAYLICFIYHPLHLRPLYPWSGCVFLRECHEQNIIALGIGLRKEPTGPSSPTLQQDSGALGNVSVCKSYDSGLTWVFLK